MDKCCGRTLEMTRLQTQQRCFSCLWLILRSKQSSADLLTIGMPCIFTDLIFWLFSSCFHALRVQYFPLKLVQKIKNVAWFDQIRIPGGWINQDAVVSVPDTFHSQTPCSSATTVPLSLCLSCCVITKQDHWIAPGVSVKCHQLEWAAGEHSCSSVPLTETEQSARPPQATRD